ncbi:uncharacterized protein [Aegilops tauschii subsp. strangulata]|uniref:uncharacterized protein n=1 Tax=Aegilops tauschii subsp. strangulata TaxID=200361 RepID=UPI001ABCD6B4|nr:uncharacterized protein LOC120964800 [Aegilops tauschii subsp. strangulata]
MATAEWNENYPDAHLKHLTAATFDHCPILLNFNGTRPPDQKKTFKYEVMWETHETWNTFGSVRKEIKSLKHELDHLRSDPARSAPSHVELKINEKLIELYHREELMWRQLSRLEWLSAGDKNTRFFHLRASQRRKRNMIKALADSLGVLTEEPGALRALVTDFYKSLYTSEGVSGIEEVLSKVPTKVTEETNAMLLAPYTKDERSKAKSNSYCALKLDMMKAYDRLEWPYLKAMMEKLGFAQSWIQVVMNMVQSVKFSVLFNGEKLEQFVPTRDGSLLLFKSRVEGAVTVSNLLETYCKASGQQINNEKSSIFFSKGCSQVTRDNIKQSLNVHNESLSDRYLGMPTDVGQSKMGTFKYLRDRVWEKVRGWMEKLLSAAGKEAILVGEQARKEEASMGSMGRHDSTEIHGRVIDDFWAWEAERSGRFTVRSAYQMVMNKKYHRENWIDENAGASDLSASGKAWKDLWHTKVPAKLRVFLWRLAQHSMPSMDVLHHRHMSTTHLCALCGCADSWRHALFDCTMSRCIWSLSEASLVEQVSMNTDTNARNWLFAMHDHLPQKEFVVLAVTLWSVWKARRKAIYEGIFQSPDSTHQFIQAYLRDLDTLEETGSKPPERRQCRPTHWINPPDAMFKFNVDAAVPQSQRRGIAVAICRDHDGIFQGASALVVKGVYDPPTVEALAIREALALAADLNIQSAHVASDCRTVVDDIKQRNPTSYGAILHEIIDQSSSFSRCSFVHEFRSLNFETHNLAKHSLKLGMSRHVWLGHPGDLSCVPLNIDLV